MRWLKSALVLALGLFALPVRAQDTAPPPEQPAPSEPPPTPPPPAPAPQAHDQEEPPAHRPAPAPEPRRRREPEPEPRGAGFGLEVATAGLASGTLQGGLLLGAHTPGGSLYGVRIDYRDETQKLAGTSQSTTAFSFGLAGRFPVAGSPDGFDLALGIDAAYVKASVTDGGAGQAPSGGSGFLIGFGPQLRYWLHPNVAVGYLAQLTYLSATSDDMGGLRDKVEHSITAFTGSFTLSAGF